jgi:long-chain fatty acid transport protein
VTHTRRFLFLAIPLVLHVTPAAGQTNERAYESLEFRVITPGARASAMGNTFVGLADDATAAASNPAGLSNLLKPELSAEWFGADMRHARMVTVDPTTTQTFAQFVADPHPSFGSFVMPLPELSRLPSPLRTVTVGLFYNELQRYEEHFSIPNISTANVPITQGGYSGGMDISADAFGAAAAFLIGPTLSVGAALTVEHLHLDVDSQTTEPSGTPGIGVFRSGSITNGGDTELAGQVGVLWKPTGLLTIGACYLPGTTFHTTTTISGVFADENNVPHDVSFYESPVQPIDYRVPTRLAVGTSVRPTSNLTLVGDAVFVRYSELVTPNFLIVDFLGQKASSGLTPSLYYFNDVIELHTGAEYRRLWRAHVIALRGGVYTDPDHQMRFDRNHVDTSGQADGQRLQFDSYYHGTVIGVSGGVGVVWHNRFQLDGAVNWSANTRAVIISSVVRFPH